MKIFTHNFNPRSNSGPNKFTRQLFSKLIKNHNLEIVEQKDADLEFCLIQQQCEKLNPSVLRLDGIYFNSEQDYKSQNRPIKYAYDNADLVIFQSEFNKKLTEHWFGSHKNSIVIHNAADVNIIKKINKDYWDQKCPKDIELWCCASSWRPHKRLRDNIEYFKKYAPKDAVMAIAGSGAEIKDINTGNERVFYLGELDYTSLLSLYKRSSTFIHLAYMDHCPNVVVDAQASGCKIICSSTGGTSEIVSDGIAIQEENWDYSPIKLYKPPKLDFSKSKKIIKEAMPNLNEVSNKYFHAFRSVI